MDRSFHWSDFEPPHRSTPNHSPSTHSASILSLTIHSPSILSPSIHSPANHSPSSQSLPNYSPPSSDENIVIPETDSSESDASQTSENDLSMPNDVYVPGTPTESDEEVQPNDSNLIENDNIFETDPSENGSSEASENSIHQPIDGDEIVPETSSESSEDNVLVPLVGSQNDQFSAFELNTNLQMLPNENHRVDNEPQNLVIVPEKSSESEYDGSLHSIHANENDVIPDTDPSSSSSRRTSHNEDDIQDEIYVSETPSASEDESNSIHSNATEDDIIPETESSDDEVANQGSEHEIIYDGDQPMSVNSMDNESIVPETPPATDDENHSTQNSVFDDVNLTQNSNDPPVEYFSADSSLFSGAHLHLDQPIGSQINSTSVDSGHDVDDDENISQYFTPNLEERGVSQSIFSDISDINIIANVERYQPIAVEIINEPPIESQDANEPNVSNVVEMESADDLENVEEVENAENVENSEEVENAHQNEFQPFHNLLSQRERDFPFLVPGPLAQTQNHHQNDQVRVGSNEDDNSDEDVDDDETILLTQEAPIEICARSREIIERIERLIANVINDLRNGNRIQLVVQNRSDWSNCFIEDERFQLMPISDARCRHIKSTFTLSVIFFVLAEIHEMLLTNRKCTVRELYYKDINVTKKQENVNEALKTICCLLDATPWELGVLSTSKGLIAGPLKIHLPDNVIIDCNNDKNGITLPHLTYGIVDLRTTATHVLVVEKDTVFKTLLQCNIIDRWNNACILITGKGYPDMNTRLILSKLRELHTLPIHIVTDADPYGIEIMLTYRHGSLSMSNLAEALAVPSIRWLGIFPSDIRKFGIRAVPLSDEDKRKLDNILNRPFINDLVHRELLIMKQVNLKAEIEEISYSSCTYLIDVYLRNKIDNNNGI